MAQVTEHLAQWRHNRQFVSSLGAEYPDWAVTACFYLAIHAVEALLTADGARPRCAHQDRLRILQSEQRYEKISRSFHVLYDLAHGTRYSATPSRWIPADQIDQRVIRGLVYPIETSVRKLLAASHPPVPMDPHTEIVLKAGSQR